MQYKAIMAPMLPEEVSLTLLDQIPCRALQGRQLLALLSVSLPVRLFNTLLIRLSPPCPVLPPSFFTVLKRQGRA